MRSSGLSLSFCLTEQIDLIMFIFLCRKYLPEKAVSYISLEFSYILHIPSKKWICCHLLGIVVFLAIVRNRSTSKMICESITLKSGNFNCASSCHINLAFFGSHQSLVWVKVHDYACWICCTKINVYYQGGTWWNQEKHFLCVIEANICFYCLLQSFEDWLQSVPVLRGSSESLALVWCVFKLLMTQTVHSSPVNARWLLTVVFPGTFGVFKCAMVWHARTGVIVQKWS